MKTQRAGEGAITERGRSCGFMGDEGRLLSGWHPHKDLLGVRERAVQVPRRDLQDGVAGITTWRRGWHLCCLSAAV